MFPLFLLSVFPCYFFFFFCFCFFFFSDRVSPSLSKCHFILCFFVLCFFPFSAFFFFSLEKLLCFLLCQFPLFFLPKTSVHPPSVIFPSFFFVFLVSSSLFFLLFPSPIFFFPISLFLFGFLRSLLYNLTPIFF